VRILEDNIEVDLMRAGCEGLTWFSWLGTAQRWRIYGHGNEAPDYIKCWKYFDQLGNNNFC
jgi:hypothetical protein